jgi:hypothetical protein
MNLRRLKQHIKNIDELINYFNHIHFLNAESRKCHLLDKFGIIDLEQAKKTVERHVKELKDD